MSSRRNCTHRAYTSKQYVRKVHRLAPHMAGYLTLCRIGGQLVCVETPTEVRMYVRSAADHNFPVTDVDLDVTCSKCVRVTIGEPIWKKKVPKTFRSAHLRRAVMPLGLLKG